MLRRLPCGCIDVVVTGPPPAGDNELPTGWVLKKTRRATGTEGQTVRPDLASCLMLSECPQSTVGDADRQSIENAVESKSPCNMEENAMKQGPGSVCTSGGGPGLQNQWAA